MLSAAETLGDAGPRADLLALWTPNLVLASIGVVLFVRQAQETARPGDGLRGAPHRRRVGAALATALRRAS